MRLREGADWLREAVENRMGLIRLIRGRGGGEVRQKAKCGRGTAGELTQRKGTCREYRKQTGERDRK